MIRRVKELAEKKGISMSQLALAWLLHKPAVSSPIIGANKLHHMEDSLKAVDVELNRILR